MPGISSDWLCIYIIISASTAYFFLILDKTVSVERTQCMDHLKQYFIQINSLTVYWETRMYQNTGQRAWVE